MEMPENIDKLLLSNSVEDQILGIHLLKAKYPCVWKDIFETNDINNCIVGHKYRYIDIAFQKKTIIFIKNKPYKTLDYDEI